MDATKHDIGFNDTEWRKIHNAVMSIQTGGAKRIDGDGWKVYQAGSIVRIDIHPQPSETGYIRPGSDT